MHPQGWAGRGTCTTKGFCLFTGGQCRQPRRGGTGGDGTIRRKRRRRLRWSSPPGQGEQVPQGGLPSLSPACLFTLAYFPAPLPRRGRISPRPPSRREGGDLRLFYARGFAPCIPGAVPGRHWRNYGQPFAFALAANRRLLDAGHLYGCLCKCRKRFGAGVPGAEPPAK